MEHYFSKSPSSVSRRKRIAATFFGRTFSFFTDASVFSKDRIDFGTRLMLESTKIQRGDSLLDLGCGYGVVGIVLSSLCRKVVMVDVNRRACLLSEMNLEENEVKNASVICGSLKDLKERFDVILFNPPIRAGKKTYLPLIGQAPGHLNEGGSIYVVARTSLGAKSIYEYMAERYDVEYASKKAGYRVMVGKV